MKTNAHTHAMTKGLNIEVVAEYQFAAPRRWRFDYAIPALRVALEVEGAVWTGGRHTRGGGYLRDMEKYNEAALRGWLVVRCTPKGLWTDGLELLRRAVEQRTSCYMDGGDYLVAREAVKGQGVEAVEDAERRSVNILYKKIKAAQ